MVTARSPERSRSAASECGLASGRWLKSAQAYRKMCCQHPLDHRQDAQLAHGASQDTANCKRVPADWWSPSTPTLISLKLPEMPQCRLLQSTLLTYCKMYSGDQRRD
ncbi:hypothetical protein P7K49_031799 [Saguinus oedipus]|uniref:Uncharacterized protein n=1 Tax=Saguinus oedipus TaxID=9490 RepID=A0ABQ9U0F6_SAGOE|nr:hypothetical protein P7K49_031799 [Saguinus oedipus]